MAGHAPDPSSLTADQIGAPTKGILSQLHIIGIAMFVIGMIGSFAIGAGTKQLAFSWLVSFTYFISIALGGLFFVLIQYATRAGWSISVRRLAENAMGTLPLFILPFIFVYIWRGSLFKWTDAAWVAQDHLMQSKLWWLTESRFLIRGVISFAVWTILAVLYLRWSTRQDQTGDEKLTRWANRLSGPAIILFSITVTFGALDWIMSLDPHWYSTIFGVYYFSGCFIAILSWMIIVATLLRGSGYLKDVVTAEHFHDLGKLLFGFVVFWAYIGFSQYFLIWYGNIPEETAWYLHRTEGSWNTVAILLCVGHFALPFLFLMGKWAKRGQLFLLLGAIWMMVMHWVDLHWMIMPTLHHDGMSLHALDVLTFIGMGGLFFAGYGFLMRRSSLVPTKDPRLAESLAFENF